LPPAPISVSRSRKSPGEETMTHYSDGGEALLESFRALDIDYIFCSSGSEWAPLWEAVTRQKISQTPGPVYLDFMHETLAVDMAIGYTLVSGRMQAVLLHATPGLLQGANGIHGALLGDVPMLVFSSEANSYGDREGVDPGSQWYRNLSIVGGPHSVVDRIVKWSCQIPGIETLYEFTKRAGEIAQRTPSGPVYLNCPVEVLLEPWQKPANAKAVATPGTSYAGSSDISALAEEINAASNPVIITESVGRQQGGFDALIEFAEAFDAPVLEPQSATCANFPKDNPLYLGGNVDGMRGKTDLIVLVNCRSPWYPPSNTFPNARVVVVDDVPQRPQMVYQVLHADRYVTGNVPHTLREAAKLASGSPERRANVETQHMGQRNKRLDAETAANANVDAIDAVALATTLREQLPENYRIFDETITHARVVQQHVRPSRASSYFYVQGGLGQGVGVALGGKLANPDTFTVLAVGDGSFLYNPIVQALQASKQNGLPILVVVFNNRQYLSMKYNHLRFYPDGDSVEHKMFHGVELGDQPPLEAFAEPFGFKGIAVSDPAQLENAVKDAISSVLAGTTTILNVYVTK